MGKEVIQEELDRRAAAFERAEANRLALEEERRRKLAERARQAAEQAEKARQARDKAEQDREKAAAERLRELQAKWAEADKHVERLRNDAYATAGTRVAAWKSRREEAVSRSVIADVSKDKRMAEAFNAKEQKFEEWRQQTVAELKRKKEMSAAVRAAASSRFEGEVEERNSRLKMAQRQAAARRRAKEEERREEFAERAEMAEKRWDEAWAARLRVEREREAERVRLEVECLRKAEQAENFLQKKRDAIEGKRGIQISRAQSSTELRADPSCWRF